MLKLRKASLFFCLGLLASVGCAATKPIYPITGAPGRFTVLVARFFHAQAVTQSSLSELDKFFGRGATSSSRKTGQSKKSAIQHANEYAKFLRKSGYEAYVADLGSRAWVTVGIFQTVEQAVPTRDVFVEKAKRQGMANPAGTGPKEGLELTWPRIVSIANLKKGPIEPSGLIFTPWVKEKRVAPRTW